MKRVLYATLAALVIIAATTLATAQSQTQPLGDYARAVKKAKPATAKPSKTYDNDTMPDKGTVSVVGSSTPEPDKDSSKDSAAATATSSSGEKTDAAKNPEVKVGQSSEDREKAFSEWKQKIDDQKSKVELLSRELDVLQRERQIKQADFYASTARAVQNSRGFDEEDAKYKGQIADKQKALDDAKAKLNEFQEEARKAGAPNSARE